LPSKGNLPWNKIASHVCAVLNSKYLIQAAFIIGTAFMGALIHMRQYLVQDLFAAKIK
jgi:hypothetical protein